MPDILQVLRSTTLSFVGSEPEIGDVATFHFTPASTFRHRAGQHGLFTAAGVSGVHPFTLANAPCEEVVSIGTHVRQGSAFKQHLAGLRPGDTLKMRGPMLDFHLDDDAADVVLLAQGIGITPFRSMLIDARERGLGGDRRLVHVGAQHPYRAVTEALADECIYPSTRVEFAADVERLVRTTPASTYYVSGDADFVRTTTAALRGHGLRASQIKTDAFRGY